MDLTFSNLTGDLGLPSQVTNVILTRGSYNSSASVEASWTPVDGRGVTYNVCYNTIHGTEVDEPPSTSDCITGVTEPMIVLYPLINRTTYYVWISARNRMGRGSYSFRQQITTYQRKHNINTLLN